MPSFTTTYANIFSSGPVITVSIALPKNLADALKAKGSQVPPPVQITALIDTGATTTVLKPEIIQQLKLNPIDQTKMSTPSCADVICNVYHASIVFEQAHPSIIVESNKIIEAPLTGQSIQGLIGRDILGLGVLIYTGYANQITLSF